MKKITLISIFIVFGYTVFALQQSDTIKTTEDDFDTLLKIESNGGYGGFSIGYTNIDGQNSFIAGFKGGWIMNHYFVLGAAGYGFGNCQNCSSTGIVHGSAGGYGGILFEPIFWSKNNVHLSVPIIIGGGGMGYYVEDMFTGSAAFVFAPGVELELNMTKFFRFAIGVDYRFTSDLYFDSLILDRIIPDNVMQGLSAHAVFKFGKF
jgi:hypothetical protein